MVGWLAGSWVVVMVLLWVQSTVDQMVWKMAAMRAAWTVASWVSTWAVVKAASMVAVKAASKAGESAVSLAGSRAVGRVVERAGHMVVLLVAGTAGTRVGMMVETMGMMMAAIKVVS